MKEKEKREILNTKGAIVSYVLVFGAVFLIMLGGLLGFILFQVRTSKQRLAWNQALHIAEAGINYYRWCLNNGVESGCLNEKDYFDVSGNLIGHFSLSATPSVSCGETSSVDIISRGWDIDYPDIDREIGVLYGRTSVAQFSYILNSNVWIGSDHEIRGPYHSNAGIRMDGENQSLMTSALDEWICTSSFGCGSCPVSNGCREEGGDCICPGVFTTTSNSNPDLFSYPVPSFDFDGITVDLSQMKTIAQNSGIYLPPSQDIDSSADGYHLKFKNNGDVEVWIITSLSPTWAYSIEEGWHYDYFTISHEYFYATYSPPPACSVIFVEDNIWPEGEIKGKITLASANLIDPNLDTNTILAKDIDYTSLDGSDGFALISQGSILIGPQSENILEIRGIFIAQKGRFSRNHYPSNFRDKLEIYGSIVSNGRVGTKWVSGSQIVSGYLKRESYYDANLIYKSPPFVPYTSPQFLIVNWEEIE